MAISTDTRTIKAGDIFIPIKGDNFNGHDYIKTALEAGALKAYSEKTAEELGLEDAVEKITVVEDTLLEYHKLAQEYRKSINPIVIGVTGSSGKTTCKEMLRLILSEKYKVYATSANNNNEIGVPKTILEMPEDTEILVLEMGMRGLGEIELLSSVARPNMAIITNIGTAHIERLGSKDAIEQAKLEITSGLEDYNGTKIEGIEELPSTLIVDHKLYERIYYRDQMDELKAEQIFEFGTNEQFKIAGLCSSGIHADANAAAIAASLLGISHEVMQVGLSKYQTMQGRGSIHKDQHGTTWIDDSYNANPDSVRSSIEAFMKKFPGHFKIAIVGDIAESKDELIRELFSELITIENEKFMLVDGRNKKPEDIKFEIQDTLRTFREIQLDPEYSLKDNQVAVLVKGSRSAGLEKILDLFSVER